ncbi:MAG TPA: hypothetical protein ENI07_15765 [Desulfobacterales bacterium]|nr:hypothetical protein [Desulfobacterales bacterium]
MVKICEYCFNIFNHDVKTCPMRSCGGWSLIGVDDMMAEVLMHYWMAGYQTIFSCAGHLYENLFNPYIGFGFHHEGPEGPLNIEYCRETLSRLHDYLVKFNKDHRVIIEKPKQYNNRDMFEVKAIETIKAIEHKDYSVRSVRLGVQGQFIGFLYDALEDLPIDD